MKVGEARAVGWGESGGGVGRGGRVGFGVGVGTIAPFARAAQWLEQWVLSSPPHVGSSCGWTTSSGASASRLAPGWWGCRFSGSPGRE